VLSPRCSCHTTVITKSTDVAQFSALPFFSFFIPLREEGRSPHVVFPRPLVKYNPRIASNLQCDFLFPDDVSTCRLQSSFPHTGVTWWIAWCWVCACWVAWYRWGRRHAHKTVFFNEKQIHIFLPFRSRPSSGVSEDRPTAYWQQTFWFRGAILQPSGWEMKLNTSSWDSKINLFSFKNPTKPRFLFIWEKKPHWEMKLNRS